MIEGDVFRIIVKTPEFGEKAPGDRLLRPESGVESRGRVEGGFFKIFAGILVIDRHALEMQGSSQHWDSDLSGQPDLLNGLLNDL